MKNLLFLALCFFALDATAHASITARGACQAAIQKSRNMFLNDGTYNAAVAICKKTLGDLDLPSQLAYASIHAQCEAGTLYVGGAEAHDFARRTCELNAYDTAMVFVSQTEATSEKDF
jgi:hypothetical protein